MSSIFFILNRPMVHSGHGLACGRKGWNRVLTAPVAAETRFEPDNWNGVRSFRGPARRGGADRRLYGIFNASGRWRALPHPGLAGGAAATGTAPPARGRRPDAVVLILVYIVRRRTRAGP